MPDTVIANLPRVVPVGGPVASFVLGLVLLAIYTLAGRQWPLAIQEGVCLAGWLNVAAGLGNLLPAPSADGMHVWEVLWRTRPAFLAYIPGLQLVLLAPALAASQLPSGGTVHQLFGGTGSWLQLWILAFPIAAVAYRLYVPSCEPAAAGQPTA